MISIFRGKVCKNKYFVINHHDIYSTITGTAINNGEPKIISQKMLNGFEQFMKGDIEVALKIGEKIRFDKLNIETEIINKTWAIEGYYVYDCDYVIRTEDDLESKEKAELSLSIALSEYRVELADQLKKDSIKWYEFWKR